MTYQLQDHFKQAMRRLAANVSLVSCNANNRRTAITATAICSLTVEPPSLVACINQKASVHPGLTIDDHYCVNLLKQGQEEISNVFGGITKSDDKFAFGDWDEDAEGVPYLSDAQANIFCAVHEIIDFSSHSIVIGHVLRVQLNEIGEPLVYFDGGYL